MYNVEKKPTKTFGLKHFPDISPRSLDGEETLHPEYRPSIEITDRNMEKIRELLETVPHHHGILDIGIAREGNGGRSFTFALLSSKEKDEVYLGVDIDDKTYLDSKEKNIHTIREKSESQNVVRAKLKELGVEKLSVLFIDGWHSVNATINDWEYADLVAEGGLVILHDTNSHSGPVVLMKAINQEYFSIEVFFREFEDDYGMACATRIKK